MAERPTKSAAELGHQSWCRLADVVRQFEQAWQSGSNPELAQFLPPSGDPLRERVLVELIKVDQEYRWQAGRPQELDVYLIQWPELRRKPETMIELVEAECLNRACQQAIPTREELGARFPDLAPQIDLAAVTARVQQEQTPSEGRVPLPATVGRRFGRYEIRQQLGRGGMGTVYRAYDTHLEREVALKIPQQDVIADEVVRERFLREARSAAAIRHRNVCPIYDAGQIDGTYYIAMALIEGRSLADWMEDRTIDPRQAAELVAKLARALEAVHAAGVLHRDVKPSNVMIDASGEPLLMDFGLARQTESRSRLTDSGSFLGTPAYMSPEQADGKPADARSDVYGLGLMLYQMLTGRLPFSGPPARLLHNIVHAPPPKPGRLRPDLDLRLEQICLKAMAKIPGTRYQTAGQLAEALEQHLRSATPPSRRPRPAWLAAAGAAAILLLGVMIYVKTNKGTLVLEIDPPDVNVTVDGNQVHVKSPRDEIWLTVGEHHLEVTKDGFQTQTDSFTIRRGGKTEVVARLESASSRPPGTPEAHGQGTQGEGTRKPREHPAVKIEMVTVGDPGNAACVMNDGTTRYGAVAYTYRIGKYEVTAAQYTAFLNAVAKTDTYGLYDSRMSWQYDATGIVQSGSPGNYIYSLRPLQANRPVSYVNFWDALRFVNWLHNGQPSGAQDASTTEDGAYTLNGYTGSGGGTITRNAGAKYWLPNGDEWYKAAYYKGGGTNAGYWKYPTQSDTLPSNDLSKPDPGNNANYSIPGGVWPPERSDMTIGAPYRTEVGAFTNSESAYGTFDQAGNVFEWFETLYPNGRRGLAGGAWYDQPAFSGNDWCVLPDDSHYPPGSYLPTQESGNFGFRVAGVAADEKEKARLLPPTPLKPRPSQSVPP